MTAANSSEAGQWTYRPYLDGLRALAVYLVVAFHAGVDRLSGGFVGVDVFFVLSGYLVTGLLLREVEGRGRIRFSGFYSRRVRRLLPAAVVNLVVTTVVVRLVFSPAEFPDALGGIRAAALYVSNWWFIWEGTDYFGSDVAASPVKQYWSLSVEEQFYLVWPLVLVGVALATRRAARPRRWCAGALGALGLFSLVAALILSGTDPDRAYFATYTRIYQLVAGALLALLPGIVGRLAERAGRAANVLAGLAGLVGILLLATSLIELGPAERGVATTVATVVLLVALEGGGAGRLHRTLSIPVLTYLGRISYSTYLWHWIVSLVLIREFDSSPLVTLVCTATVASGLAAASYHLMERPIRKSARLDRHPLWVIVIGLAMSALVAFVVAPLLLDVDSTVRGIDGSETVDWREAQRDVPDLDPCDLGEQAVCTLVEGDGPKVLLVGDSHAATLAPALAEVARRQGFELSSAYLSYCPWTRGIRYGYFGGDCFDEQDALYRERIPAYQPDLVVLAQRPLDDPNEVLSLVDPDEGLSLVDREEGPIYFPAQRDRLVEQATSRSLSALAQRSIPSVIVESIPVTTPDDPPIRCIADGEDPRRCSFRASAGPLSFERIVRGEAERREDVWTIDLDRDVCPRLPTCDAIVDGHIVMYDTHHLTGGFAATLADPIEAWMLENGVLE